MKRPTKIVPVLVAALIVALSANSFGQTTNPATPAGAPGRLVKLHLIVSDRSNHSLDELRKEELQVFEGKAEQTIALFERDEGPIDYGLVIDTTGSFKPVMGSILDAMKMIIDNKRPGDEIFIERFASSDKIETVQDFTADKERLLAARKELRVEGGQTALVDAIYVAVEHVAKRQPKERRKAIVLMTDGEDRASYYSVDKLVKNLRETNIQVFVIGIVTKLSKDGGLVRQSPRIRAEELLMTVAEESGGRVFFPKDVGELEKATAEIIHDLHSQFVIGYESTNSGKTGFRKVEVKLLNLPNTEKRNLIVPSGYYVDAPGPKAKP